MKTITITKEHFKNNIAETKSIGVDPNDLTKEIYDFVETKNKESLFIQIENSSLIASKDNDKFIITISINEDESILTLCQKHTENSSKSLFIGGQQGLFSDKICATADQAKQAILFFCKNNKPDPSLIWQEE